jgi:hypothetical protein
MGKESHRLRRRDVREDVGKPEKAESPKDLKRLEADIARTRRRLDEYVDELDRRRHRLLAVREHPVAAAGAALGAAALIAGTVVLIRRRASARRRTQRKSQNIWEAFHRMAQHPERVASDGKSPWSRIAVAVAPILVKKIADAALHRR